MCNKLKKNLPAYKRNLRSVTPYVRTVSPNGDLM